MSPSLTHSDQVGDFSPSFGLSPRLILIGTIAFVAAIGLLNRAMWFIDHHVTHLARAPYWPIGVFEPRLPGAAAIAAAAGCMLLFAIVMRMLERSAYRLPAVVSASLALMVATNSLHGFEAGFVKPIAGTDALPRIQYY